MEMIDREAEGSDSLEVFYNDSLRKYGRKAYHCRAT